MINGQRDVTCWGDIRIKMTRKQRKTADCTAGDVGIVLKLSAKRSIPWNKKKTRFWEEEKEEKWINKKNWKIIIIVKIWFFWQSHLGFLASVFDIGPYQNKILQMPTSLATMLFALIPNPCLRKGSKILIGIWMPLWLRKKM